MKNNIAYYKKLFELNKEYIDTDDEFEDIVSKISSITIMDIMKRSENGTERM